MSYQGLLNQAERYEEELRYSEALNCLKKARKQEEFSYDLNLELKIARLEKYSGNVSSAESTYTKILKKDPNCGDAIVGMGLLYLDNDEDQKASGLFELAAEKYPESHTFVLLGESLERLERESEAIDCYRKAIKLDDEFSEPFYKLAVLLEYENESFDEAISLLEKAVKIDPEYQLALAELGKLYLKRGDLEAAEKELLKAIKLKGKDHWSSLFLGNLYIRKKQVSDAKEMFNRALESEECQHLAKKYLKSIESM